MSVAETARLAVEMTLGGNFNAGMAASEASLSKLNATAEASTGHASRLSGAFGLIGTAAGKAEGALSHAGSQLRNLATGPLGLIGLTGGLLSVGGAIEKGLSKASDWGSAIARLGSVTGDTADQLSGLLAVTDRYGIATARVVTVAGFAEKAMQAVKLSTGGAAKFQADYGFSILDSAGRVKDFNSLLLTFSDYYKSNADKAQAAAAAAKLFGRGYTDLVPVLSLGSAKIRDLQQEAAQLGLTLTATNVKDLAAFKEATRGLGDALGGLELQIGLALIPALKDLATAAASFVAGHRGDIVAFFKNAVAFGQQAVATIRGVVGALSSAWGSIPPELRDLLVRGLVADRTVKFLFGFSPIGAALSGIEGALSKGLGNAVGAGLAQAGLGKLFVQPVFVTNPGFGGPGGLGGIAEGAAGAGGAGVVGTLAAAGAVTALATAALYGMYYGIPSLFNRGGPGEGSAARTLPGLSGLSRSSVAQYGAYGPMGNLLAQRALDTGTYRPGKERDDLIAGLPPLLGKAADDVVQGLSRSWGGLALAVQHFSDARARVDSARAQSDNANRRYVASQLAAAQKTATGTEDVKRKTDDLKRIQADLVRHGDTWAAKEVALLGQIAGKDWSISITTAAPGVSSRDVTKAAQKRARFTGKSGYQAT